MFINIFCVILNVFTGRYFSEYINAHIFKQLQKEFAIKLYGNISTISLVILLYFVIPLLHPPFPVIFSNPPVCHTLSSTFLFCLLTLGLMIQIKCFQLPEVRNRLPSVTLRRYYYNYCHKTNLKIFSYKLAKVVAFLQLGYHLQRNSQGILYLVFLTPLLGNHASLKNPII